MTRPPEFYYPYTRKLKTFSTQHGFEGRYANEVFSIFFEWSRGENNEKGVLKVWHVSDQFGNADLKPVRCFKSQVEIKLYNVLQGYEYLMPHSENEFRNQFENRISENNLNKIKSAIKFEGKLEEMDDQFQIELMKMLKQAKE